MTTFSKAFFKELSHLKGSGHFATIGSIDYLIPGMFIVGVGELSFPLNQNQAKTLIAVAHQAPYGKGSQTFVDKTVRNTWEIDAKKIKFNNPKWTSHLEKIIEKVKSELGLEDYQIKAHLYKLLIYEEGGFFLKHKDTEKEKGMFGTLVLNMPSTHNGGELEISFNNKVVKTSFENQNMYDIGFVAFYADCDHEVKPVTSGYKVSLIFNLIQEENGLKITAPQIDQSVLNLSKLIKDNQSQNVLNPYIVLLDHQYTPENFSYKNLKLDDRIKVETLIKTAESLGYYYKLCLVTSYLEGAPEYDGYDEDSMDMDEVFNEELYIEHWDNRGIPGFGHYAINEDFLIKNFELNEGDPDESESTGYMGNYGPDIMYWYYYGAIMLWSPDTSISLISQSRLENKLLWIDYFNKKENTTDEISLVNSIISVGFTDNLRETTDLSPIINWVIKTKQLNIVINMFPEKFEAFFSNSDTDLWQKLFSICNENETKLLIDKIIGSQSVNALQRFVVLVNSMKKNEPLNKSFNKILLDFDKIIQDNYSTVLSNGFNVNILNDICEMSNHLEFSNHWCENITDIIISNLNHTKIQQTIKPWFSQKRQNNYFTQCFIKKVKYYLENRKINKPQPPADWSRKVPDSKCFRKEFNILKPFLESPTESVLDFKNLLSERRDMENAIRSVKIDLKFETIRKGSPHTLRITKTQSEYKEKLKEWEMDMTFLNAL